MKHWMTALEKTRLITTFIFGFGAVLAVSPSCPS